MDMPHVVEQMRKLAAACKKLSELAKSDNEGARLFYDDIEP